MDDHRLKRLKSREPLEMWEALAEEFEASGKTLPASFEKIAAGYYASPQTQTKEDVETALFQAFHQQPRTALCFSGGGVRSATFGLGVMHGLAKAKFKTGKTEKSPLPEFDYLSTVSGGGYVGGWFSAWAAREEKNAKDGEKGAEAVAAALDRTPVSKLDPEPGPLLHLRKYCRFLNPKMGALSADTWTLAATVARNMLLNWLVLIPLFMAVLILPLMYHIAVGEVPNAGVIQVFWWIGGALAIWAAAYVGFHIPTLSKPKGAAGDRPRGTEMSFVFLALLPFALSAIALTLHWVWYVETSTVNYTLDQFCLFGAVTYGAGALLASAALFVQRRVGLLLALIGCICAVLSGAAAGFAGYHISNLFLNLDLTSPGGSSLYTCLAVPLVLLTFNVAAILAVGLTSRVTDDNDREWWARAAGWVLIVVMVWLIFSAASAAIVIAGWLEGTWHRIVAAICTLGVGGVASKLGQSLATAAASHEKEQKDGKKRTSAAAEIGAKVAGPLFLLMLIGVLAMADDALLDTLDDLTWVSGPLGLAALLAVALFLVAVVCSWFININRFSLHAMYRARLLRTYLGASRADRARTANLFTDFDEGDNMAMSELSPHGPLHIVNMALNLVGGKNLAWQQRKAESFTASRLRTGSLRVGYQDSRRYASRAPGTQGFTLGSAIAISGAAASPNMGYHSSALLSLVMTLFNARLGWWLANPGAHGKGKWDHDGPTWSVVPILNEAFGRTNDESRWVYLSDGGHFENLGLYEMILRRCRTIVVVDGSQDETYTFGDLGNAVRKARVDLGIPIEFSEMPMYGQRDPRNRYCAIGTIDYQCVDPGAEPGRILYIKACLNNSEPTDVLHYASSDSMFPQQGTDKLWFDESQFESYRRLGAHIAEKLAKAATDPSKPVVEQFVDAAAAYIKPEAAFAASS
jgi:hypothetical protein